MSLKSTDKDTVNAKMEDKSVLSEETTKNPLEDERVKKLIIATLSHELSLKASQVDATIALIDEGNTIPFIARYRKEMTGGISDEVLRNFDDRLKYLRNLETRKVEVIRNIDEQGKLTDELKKAIDSATV